MAESREEVKQPEKLRGAEEQDPMTVPGHHVRLLTGDMVVQIATLQAEVYRLRKQLALLSKQP